MKRSLHFLLCGALIGAGAILPGVSGGVLCVALGVYAPIMAFLAHPLREGRTQWRMLLPLCLGFGLGVMLLSRLVAWLFAADSTLAVWLFLGLIAGSMPALWQESGKEGRTAGQLAAGAAAFAVMLLVLHALRREGSQAVPLTTATWLLCGVLWGVGLVAPGLSPSSLFIFMGVYGPMSNAIARLSLPVLLPMAAGLGACVALLSRGMNALLARAYGWTMHPLMGIALASAVAIIPTPPATLGMGLRCAACFLAGLGAALMLNGKKE